MPDMDDYYWSVDVPGLDATSADRLAEHAAAHGYSATTVDPEHFLTLHMDRETVEMLRDALSGLPTDDPSQPILEIFVSWLAAVGATG